MFEGSGGASFSHGTRIAKIDLATYTTTALSANESPLCAFDSRDVRLTGLLGREWAPADDDSHDDVDCYHCHPMASMVSAKAQNQCEEAREAKQLAFERDTSCTSESTEGQKWRKKKVCRAAFARGAEPCLRRERLAIRVDVDARRSSPRDHGSSLVFALDSLAEIDAAEDMLLEESQPRSLPHFACRNNSRE